MRQPWFSRAGLAGMLALLGCIGGFYALIDAVPDRVALGARTALVSFDPVDLGPARLGTARLAGAWRLSSPDPRFGGLSALAFDRGALLAVSDAGAIVRLALPRGRRGIATIRELPAGPGDGRHKYNRDSEALMRDPAGRGWWAAFEQHHQLWLYDPAFTNALRHVPLPAGSWTDNGGVEALAWHDDALLLFVESGSAVLRLAAGRMSRITVAGQRGTITDAVTLPDGRLMAVDRNLSVRGFRNRLVTIAARGRGLAVTEAVHLPLRGIDNVEGIAAERRRDGSTRLWLVTDDNFQPPMRTLLIAIALPHDAIAKRSQ